MGKSQRNKGRRGQSTFINMLKDRDFIVHETNSGRATEDLIAERDGKSWSVEVKNKKIIDPYRFRKQASEQARKSKKPWMIGAKIAGTTSWLVWLKYEVPTVWHE